MKSWTLWDDIRGSLHFSDQMDTFFSSIIVKLCKEVSIAVCAYAQTYILCLTFPEGSLPTVMWQEVQLIFCFHTRFNSDTHYEGILICFRIILVLSWDVKSLIQDFWGSSILFFFSQVSQVKWVQTFFLQVGGKNEGTVDWVTNACIT